METQPGCLPIALAFFLGVAIALGALFFAASSDTTVELGDPAPILMPEPSPT